MKPSERTVELSARDSLPALLGQLCGHAMNRNGAAVALVLGKIEQIADWNGQSDSAVRTHRREARMNERTRLGIISDRWHRESTIDAMEIPWLIEKATDGVYQMPSERTVSEPTPTEMIHELREALGLWVGARPESPREVWRETLAEVRRLADCERIRLRTLEAYGN